MNKLLRNSTVIASGAVVAAILAPVLARGVAPAPSPGFAPNDACVGNARLLFQAVIAYAQQNDEKLPPADTVAHFDAAVYPYLVNKAAFTCPATHLAYVPNPAVGGHSLFEYRTTADSTILFHDAQPHADHQSTVTFLDGRVERGGVTTGGVEAGDPKEICVEHVRAISLAVLQYVQDYDEQYPPLDTQAHAEAALLPYAPSPRVFICPITHQPYEFNASLSHVTLASISNPAATIVVQDSIAHPDGDRTIGYADGHVTPAPTSVAYLSKVDSGHLKQLGLALLQYAQDNNEQLPVFHDDTSFETAVYPYVKNTGVFVNPFSGQTYNYNTSLSGKMLVQIASPSTTWFAKDRSINPDGTFNTVYMDGHEVTSTLFVPAHISVGSDNETRLVWSTAGGKAGISRLSNSGAELGRKYLGAGLGTVDGVATTPTGTTSILFDSQDISTPSALNNSINTASLLTLNAGYAQTQFVHYGPFDGWTPNSIAVGGNGLARLLWGRYDHTYAIWQDTATGEYASDVRYGPYAGIDGAGLAAGADNALSVYWKRPAGETVLSRLSPGGVAQTTKTISAFRGRQPVAITVASDNSTWLLFDRADGGATIYAFDAQLAVTDRIEFNPEAGWTAKDLGVGADGNVRVLSNDQHGDGRLRIVTPAGSIVSSHDYAAF